MATSSNSLAWKIPWTEEPGGLQSLGAWWATVLGSLVGYSPREPGGLQSSGAWWATVHGVAKSQT